MFHNSVRQQSPERRHISLSVPKQRQAVDANRGVKKKRGSET